MLYSVYLFSKTTLVSKYKNNIYHSGINEARDYGFWDDSGIPYATVCTPLAVVTSCSIASCTRQITMLTPYKSKFTGQMFFLMPNQQCPSTEGITKPNCSYLVHTFQLSKELLHWMSFKLLSLFNRCDKITHHISVVHDN